MNLTFFIPGIARPGGSKTAFALKHRDGRPVLRPNGSQVVVVTDAAGKSNKEWKQQCAVFARQHYQGPPATGPLSVTFKFFRTRPKDHYRSQSVAARLASAPPQLKDWADSLYPTTKPDVLKLARAAEDALTGILWVDDALIVQEHLYKDYDRTPGLLLSVQSMDLITMSAMSDTSAKSDSSDQSQR